MTRADIIRAENSLTREALREDLAEAERKAWDSLSRYKFQMFGYWASIWVHLNRIGHFGQPNPFLELVKRGAARRPFLPKAEPSGYVNKEARDA